MLVQDNDDLPIMKQRQRTAFPPNYIHSIDSSHMMLTAIACKEEGAPRLSWARLPCSLGATSKVQPREIPCAAPPIQGLRPPLPPPAPAGICFAGVHDSFWTHAGSVERMNELLRAKFVELHSQVGAGAGAGAGAGRRSWVGVA